MLLHCGLALIGSVGSTRPATNDGKHKKPKCNCFERYLKILVIRDLPDLAVKEYVAVVEALHVDFRTGSGHRFDDRFELLFRFRRHVFCGKADRDSFKGNAHLKDQAIIVRTEFRYVGPTLLEFSQQTLMLKFTHRFT